MSKAERPLRPWFTLSLHDRKQIVGEWEQRGRPGDTPERWYEKIRAKIDRRNRIGGHTPGGMAIPKSKRKRVA